MKKGRGRLQFSHIAPVAARWRRLAQSIDPTKKTVANGIWLTRQMHRRGLATEAVKLVIEEGFKGLGLLNIIFAASPVNLRSKRLLRAHFARAAEREPLLFSALAELHEPALRPA